MEQRYLPAAGVELEKPAYLDCNFNWANIDMSPDEGVYQGNYNKVLTHKKKHFKKKSTNTYFFYLSNQERIRFSTDFKVLL